MNEEITRREALKKGAILSGAAVVWVQPSVRTYGLSSTLAAQASGTAGCTPGFWKNNPGRWPGSLTPDDLVPWTGNEIGQPTFGAALDFGGGGGIAGAERSLFRAAAAAYLNAMSLGGYAYSAGEVSSMVNSAIASNDRDTILGVKDALDLENNAGCPIPADESPEEFLDGEEPGAEDGVYGRPEEDKPVEDDDDSEKKVKAEKKSGGDDE
jgi:hypothetical protein